MSEHTKQRMKCPSYEPFVPIDPTKIEGNCPFCKTGIAFQKVGFPLGFHCPKCGKQVMVKSITPLDWRKKHWWYVIITPEKFQQELDRLEGARGMPDKDESDNEKIPRFHCFLCGGLLAPSTILRGWNTHKKCSDRLEYIRMHETCCPKHMPLYHIFAKDGYYGPEKGGGE